MRTKEESLSEDLGVLLAFIDYHDKGFYHHRLGEQRRGNERKRYEVSTASMRSAFSASPLRLFTEPKTEKPMRLPENSTVLSSPRRSVGKQAK